MELGLVSVRSHRATTPIVSQVVTLDSSRFVATPAVSMRQTNYSYFAGCPSLGVELSMNRRMSWLAFFKSSARKYIMCPLR